ncbi:Endonuclease III [Jeotgalibaca dankookensis]|uniref:Endonuclease III n=1 Tax=Jeotgalibaca dankookensis TaxID=708126 RepID=A0A1S6INT3_9LACT|nr:endonuclease III [Jeotgalibaca dankookensis]AQS53214.1 Endonuclease III [Jeotgalibaca dankookensis]
MVTKERAREILEQIIALYPDAQTILKYRNNFELLIAVMLSAQTTDMAVNKVTKKLFERFPDPASFAVSSPEEIEPYIQSIGLYRNKAKYIYTCSNQLIKNFGGKVPSNRKDLESLAGIGRKTANVVLSVGFNIPAFPVDTHVSRVCKHHGIVPPDATPLEIEKIVTDILPADLWKQAHHALIFFGRNICTPRNPKCGEYLI